MKKTLVACAAALLAVFATMATSADAPCLADRHIQMGQQCQGCHATATPTQGAKVKNTQCFTCHVNYETLAQRTQAMDPNPHYTHLGNVRCTDCHSGHAQPQMMCNDCHQFDMMPK